MHFPLFPLATYWSLAEFQSHIYCSSGLKGDIFGQEAASMLSLALVCTHYQRWKAPTICYLRIFAKTVPSVSCEMQ